MMADPSPVSEHLERTPVPFSMLGHPGCNHPAIDLKTREVEIRSQNHNCAIDVDSLDKSGVEATHLNLNDRTVEGIAHREVSMSAVQYHPEACPGPRDPNYLFARFRELVRAWLRPCSRHFSVFKHKCLI